MDLSHTSLALCLTSLTRMCSLPSKESIMNGFFAFDYHGSFCEELIAQGIDPGTRDPYHAVYSVAGQMRVEKVWRTFR